ncbi:MAG TPA: hypothetical protein VME24_03645 [Alphaproteobacteria bacterium]|nr:hypothetical protein [Alphaproteobacteria bacterium]
MTRTRTFKIKGSGYGAPDQNADYQHANQDKKDIASQMEFYTGFIHFWPKTVR